jgi:hypothetical protein
MADVWMRAAGLISASRVSRQAFARPTRDAELADASAYRVEPLDEKNLAVIQAAAMPTIRPAPAAIAMAFKG